MKNQLQMEQCLVAPTHSLTLTNDMKQAWIRCWIHGSNCLREPTTNLVPTMKKHLIGLSALHLLNLKSLMTWKMSPSDPDAQYIQLTALFTYIRLGGVLKELSKARIVSVYGAYNATNFKDVNLNFEDLCLNAMETALAYYDDSLNADIFNNLNEAMNAIDAV